MGRIKSALELAMERSSGVPVDKESVRKDEWVRNGRNLGGKFISNQLEGSLRQNIDAPGKQEEEWICQGILLTFLANISLPRHESNMNQLEKASQGLQALAEYRRAHAKSLKDLLGQFRDLFRQYLENLKNIDSQIRMQWEPRLRQKEQILRQQTGQNVNLTPEQDPEFNNMLSNELSGLSEQYSEVIQKGKSEIQRIFGL